MSTPTAIVQKIDDQNLTILIDGEVREIKHQLDELKQLLLEKQVQNIQHADKIYNIEHIDNANFEFVTGKKAFNEYLTKSLLEAMRPICPPAQRFSDKVTAIPNWESQLRISNKAKEIIAYSFVGVIGIQFSKLMAIGKEDFSEAKQRKYIQKCLHIVHYSLDLVNYVLLSQVWDQQQQNSRLLENDMHRILFKRFDNAFAPTALERFDVLQTLLRLFEEHQIPLAIPELADLKTAFVQAEELPKNIKALQTLNTKLDRAQYNLLDCFEAEKQLATFFHYFSFLVNYNMASIKSIGYREIRNDQPVYLHRFTALGIDSKANRDAEKIIDLPDTVHTDSVLFYRGDDYRKNTNLYPFIIDYNTLTDEHGAKICFFQCLHLDDDSLEYVFLEDNSVVNIEKQTLSEENWNLGTLMMDGNKRKIFSLNCVVDGFERARKDILAENDLDF